MPLMGGELRGQVLVLGADVESFLDWALSEVASRDEVDYLLGIQAAATTERWQALIAGEAGLPASGRILDWTGESEAGATLGGPSGFDVRNLGAASLGDLGSAVVDSLTEAGATRPAVVIDSVTALTDDPGKQFKFLALLGRRLARDDGLLLVFEGDPGLADHEVATLEELFDEVRDTGA